MENTSTKKEWKWPLGIFLFYMTFVVGTLTFVFYTFTQKTDLVIEEYYEATLTYQDHIDKAKRANSLAEPVQFSLQGQQAKIVFPDFMQADGLNGKIQLYRPSGSSMDELLPIVTDENGVQYLSFADRTPGLWRVKVDWAFDGLDYYTEHDFFIR
ncbi:Nitrogen fixation protein FixH [Cyclonatronum proteinivorum]|uniref:Nitrogen fixation protein FixH n=1 Tax=Cyclonatronum proteinivorum TaxID=1457365 RepID=A0A345UNY1_9BACT|nr:FixH family protein [Cyclonatronum proteinivorum]AXJ02183.1 Nitrogen fixation protein FixH [Cyclonatronum proteinivorum]